MLVLEYKQPAEIQYLIIKCLIFQRYYGVPKLYCRDDNTVSGPQDGVSFQSAQAYRNTMRQLRFLPTCRKLVLGPFLHKRVPRVKTPRPDVPRGPRPRRPGRGTYLLKGAVHKGTPPTSQTAIISVLIYF